MGHHLSASDIVSEQLDYCAPGVLQRIELTRHAHVLYVHVYTRQLRKVVHLL